jgi:hypothetical protein
MQPIPGAKIKHFTDGVQQSMTYKGPNATFNLRPVKGKENTYKVQVTCKDLPGRFKNSGSSSFRWFLVTRFPGRNAVTRPRELGPCAGNAVLMWPSLDQMERNRCYEFLEKLIRSDLPRLEAEKKVA